MGKTIFITPSYIYKFENGCWYVRDNPRNWVIKPKNLYKYKIIEKEYIPILLVNLGLRHPATIKDNELHKQLMKYY